MNQAWKSRVAHIDETKTKNSRVRFNCESCGVTSTAPISTERASEKQCTSCFGKRTDKRTNKLNDLTGSEWAQGSKTVEKYLNDRGARILAALDEVAAQHQTTPAKAAAAEPVAGSSTSPSSGANMRARN